MPRREDAEGGAGEQEEGAFGKTAAGEADGLFGNGQAGIIMVKNNSESGKTAQGIELAETGGCVCHGDSLFGRRENIPDGARRNDKLW